MPPRNPKAARYVVEIRDAAGTSLLLTTVDWTAKERDATMASIFRLLGHKPADATPKPRQTRGDDVPGTKSTGRMK